MFLSEMNVRKLLTLILLSLFVVLCRAQVSGSVIDSETKVPVVAATVKLLDNDSTLVEGKVTNREGYFVFNHDLSGDYFLEISGIGYDSILLTLRDVYSKVGLGDIFICPSSTELSELVVVSKQMSRTDDRVLLFPNNSQKKHASNGYDLINNLNLPKVNVDLLTNAVTTIGGAVTLCINGREVTHDDIRGLLPQDIQRVEYHDLPSGRFSGKVAVIDFITKRYSSGGSFLVNADQRLTYPQGSYLTMARFNNNVSEYSVGYKFDFNHDRNNRQKITETFILPSGELNREIYSLPYQMKDSGHLLFLDYNLRKDSVALNLRAGYSERKTPQYEIISRQLYSDMGPQEYKSTETSSNKTIHPYLNISFNKTLNSRRYLYLYINSAYSQNNYERKFEQDMNTIYSQVFEKYLRINGGGDYTHWLDDNRRLTLQVYHFQDISKSQYQGTFESEEELSSGQAMGWIEYFKKWGQTSLATRVGGTYSFYVQNKGNVKDFFSFRPQIIFQHSINDNNTLQLRSFLGNSSPWLAFLSDVEQQIDFLTIRRGNPNLQRMIMWNNSLNYWLSVRLFNISFFMNHELFTPNQRAEVYYESGYFIKTYINDGQRNRLGIGTSISGSFLNSALRFNVSLGYNQNWVANASQSGLGGLYCNLNSSYAINNWMLRVFYNSPYQELNHQGYITKRSSIYGLSLSYNSSGLSIVAGVQNPFSKMVSTTEFANDIYFSKIQNLNSNNNFVGFLRLSYNFSYGRKYKYSNIDTNINSSSAILKGNRN